MGEDGKRLCANDCGRPAAAVPLMGMVLELPYCVECGTTEAEAEDRRQRQRTHDEAIKRAGATPRLLEQTLDTYPSDGAESLRFARAWLDRYRAGERQNLWFVGPVGSGKTGLAWGLVRELAEDAVAAFYERDEEFRGLAPATPARLIVWRDLLDQLRAEMDSATSAAAAAYERAKRVPVLALDDLGAERATGYAVERLAGLVQARYEARLPIIVTSNYEKVELGGRLGGDEPLIGQRIVDRLRDGAVGMTLARSSRRTLAA